MALFAATSHTQQTASDSLIVPGERVGPVTAGTSEVSLEARLGRENVQRIDVYLGEGFTTPGTAVYPNDPTRRMEVTWHDDARTMPKEVRLRGESSVWRTAEGISLGTTLREIERMNGVPFRVAGFGWDGSGTVVCDRGRLTMLGWSRLLVVALRPSAGAMNSLEYRQVLGDRTFSSGHPAMQTLNPRVGRIIVRIEAPSH